MHVKPLASIPGLADPSCRSLRCAEHKFHKFDKISLARNVASTDYKASHFQVFEGIVPFWASCFAEESSYSLLEACHVKVFHSSMRVFQLIAFVCTYDDILGVERDNLLERHSHNVGPHPWRIYPGFEV